MTTASELVWKLQGYTPETIPMARLAEYMRQLALLLGETADVRFLRVEKGSLKVIAKNIHGGSSITRRLDAVSHGDAPRDAMAAYHTINRMVGEDGGLAQLARGSAIIVRFPGSTAREQSIARIYEHGSLLGKLYALSEAPGGGVAARIRPADGGNAVMCTADANMAHALRGVLFEAVRVAGRGEWLRPSPGEWACASMKIDEVYRIQNVPLRQAIDQLRALDVEWPDDPLAELASLNDASGAA